MVDARNPGLPDQQFLGVLFENERLVGTDCGPRTRRTRSVAAQLHARALWTATEMLPLGSEMVIRYM